MKARSNLVQELRKSLKPGMFQDQVTAQTNKFSGIRIGRSTAPGASNTVDQAAWRAKYAACVVDWNALSPEQQAAYQAAADLRKITAFNQFMSTCLLAAPPPEYEDFTTFTEHDVAGNYLSVAANKIDISSLDSTEKYGVVKDYGVGHFGDFEHLFEFYLDSAVIKVHIFNYVLTNQDTYYIYPCYGANDGIFFRVSASTGPAYILTLHDLNTGLGDSFQSIDLDTLYFVKLKRSGSTLTADVYTGSHGGALVAAMSCTCETGTKRYLIAVGSYGDGALWTGDCVAYLQNLKLS